MRAVYERGGGVVEAHETGFWRREPALLANGARLTAGSTYLRRDGRPFLVVGANHWVNDAVWPSFPENGNALEWDRDFADMASRDLNFVRTGIWFGPPEPRRPAPPARRGEPVVTQPRSTPPRRRPARLAGAVHVLLVRAREPMRSLPAAALRRARGTLTRTR